MFIWIGAATCLYAAFAVGHSGFGTIIVFIFSKNKNLAALSIPYGLVAVWNQSADEAGHVGSVAMQGRGQGHLGPGYQGQGRGQGYQG